VSSEPTPSSGAPQPTPLGARRTLIAVIAVVVALLGVGVYLVAVKLPVWLASGETPADSATTPAAAAAERKIQAQLFYVTDDGAELQAMTREVVYGATPAEQARRIIEAQLQPAPQGRTSAVPAGVSVRALFIGAKGDAYVDFSPELRTAHTGGSLNEALTVYTIVHALTANLPGITAVQILIDGREADSLAGHIDLRHPLTRADGWVRKGQQ
jgi:hypothetical protein